MAALDKIRTQTLQLEHDRQYEKALAVYGRLLEDAAEKVGEADVALFNRAGDVALRAGQPERAVQFFERALELYASGGLLNNAIALGVKILRHAPGHLAAHYTLGVLYAKKGFRSDARHHLLTYAERMHRGAHDDEAARALGEFAALADDATQARAEVARHLDHGAAAPEVVAALTALLERTLGAADRTGESASARGSDAGALVFLDLEFGSEAPGAPAVSGPAPRAPRVGAPHGAAPTPPPAAPHRAAAPIAAPATAAPALDAQRAWTPGAVEPALPTDAAPRWASALPGEPAPLAVALLDASTLAPTRDAVDDAPDDASASDDALLWLVPPDEEHVDDGSAATDLVDALPAAWDDEGEPVDEGDEAFTSELVVLDAPTFDDDAGPTSRARDIASEPAYDLLDEVHADDLPLLDVTDGAVEAAVPSVDAELALLDVAEPAASDAHAAAVGLEATDLADVDLPGAELETFDVDALDDVAPRLDGAAGGFDLAALELPPVAAPHARDLPALDAGASGDDTASQVADAREAVAVVAGDDDGLDLGAWLRASERAPTTRMTAPAPAISDDEQATFTEALGAFTAAVARHVPDADHDSHYDLGVAYREMGLLDEAIGAFQRAARATGLPLRALEALGQCFLDREEPELALAALERAARAIDGGALAGDASAVGLCYLVASASERTGRRAEARRWYVRVLALDYSFRDAAARLALLPPSD